MEGRLCRSLASTWSRTIPLRQTTTPPTLRSIQQSRSFSHTPCNNQDRSASSKPPTGKQSTRSSGSYGGILNHLNFIPDSSPSTPTWDPARNPTSSLDDLFSAEIFQQKTRPSLDPLANRQNDRIRGLLDPQSRAAPAPIKLPDPLPHYGPSVGKTIFVDNGRGMDVAKAFGALNSNIGRNRIRSDFQAQRFHERPGLKRKRLHSQRWRRRFKLAFQDMVSTVTAMRRQGW